MFGQLGYLYREEEKVKNELKSLIGKLNSSPQWAVKVAKITDPNASPAALNVKAKAYRTVLADIERKIDGARITNLRYWRDALAGIAKIAAGAVPAPTPAPAPAPAPVPTPVAEEEDEEEEEEMPPAPPGVTCPHYTAASAFPTNWDDPAAEQRYLKKYPDVMKWTEVMKKRFKGKGLNALWHYRCYGKKEGRTWAGLDGIYGRTLGYLR